LRKNLAIKVIQTTAKKKHFVWKLVLCLWGITRYFAYYFIWKI